MVYLDLVHDLQLFDIIFTTFGLDGIKEIVIRLKHNNSTSNQDGTSKIN